MRLLLVEDDPLLGDGIATGLRQDGYALDWVRSGEQGLQALASPDFDLVILDLGLPGMDGLTLLGRLRDRKLSIPVLVLTARDSVADRVQGLDAGGDDYMVKPFDLDELSARVRALLRRSHGRVSPQLRAGDLVMDPATRKVFYRDAEVELSPREFTLLHELLEHAGQVVSRIRLQESMYGWDQSIESNAVEVHIHHLRKKLDTDLIRTVRGVGYLLQGSPLS